ncbi:hypothetical protein BC828DRAFT_384981 [Blastocladiella britannica]|nr:hypothetical protein BC828DRAFT_384981 [Blastocladiella britannica]
MTTTTPTPADWDRQVPLPDALVDLFLSLEESAVDPFHVLGLTIKYNDDGANDTPPDPMQAVAAQLATLAMAKVAPAPLDVDHPWRQHEGLLERNTADVTQLSDHLHTAARTLTNLGQHADRFLSTHAVLREATERVLREKAEVDRIAGEINAHLAHFGYLEEFAHFVAQSPMPFHDPPGVTAALGRADASLEFLAANSHFTDAALYAARFRQCMTRAMIALRNHVVSRLRDLPPPLPPVSAMVVTAAETGEAQKMAVADACIGLLAAQESSPWALEFRATCMELAPIAHQLVSRCEGHPEYHALRMECVTAYLGIRWTAVGPTMDAVLELLGNDISLVDQIEIALASLSTLVTDEQDLCATLFGQDSVADLAPLLTNVANPIYTRFRQRVLSTLDLSVLASICRLFHTDPDGVAIDNSDAIGRAARACLLSLLSDTQTQLIYRGQHRLGTTAPAGTTNYSSAMADALISVLAAFDGSVPVASLRSLAGDAVRDLVSRISTTSKAVPPSLSSPLSVRSGLAVMTTGAPPLAGDVTLLEVQLFRIRELWRLLEAVKNTKALDRSDDDSARLHRRTGAAGGGSVHGSSLSILGSVLSLANLGGPAVADEDLTNGTGPGSIAGVLEVALARARDEFLLDRVHSCTYQLKRWLVRAAAVGTVDSKVMAWAHPDAVIKLTNEWQLATESEMQGTVIQVSVYLGDLLAARSSVLGALVDGVVVVYRDFYSQVSKVFGRPSRTTDPNSGAASFMAAFMSVDGCAQWMQSAARI